MAYELLKGTRILDLTMVFAGPTSSRILASLGAEVIKVESALRPDVFTRSNVYPDNEPGDKPWNRGSFFHSLNAGKRGITLNLGTESGRDIFKRLVAISDVVMENYSPRVMSNWSLDYPKLKEIKPDLIMVSMSGLGHTGPLTNYSMYVPGLEGMSGLTYLTGYPDKPPMLSGYSYGDWMLGATAASAVLMALFYRKTTGRGQYLDIAGREALCCNIGEFIMDYTMNRRDQTRTGNNHPDFAPHGCYACSGEDNWVVIAVENEEQWLRFRQAIDQPDWSLKEEFSDVHQRLQHRDKLDYLVESWTKVRDKFIIADSLQKVGVPAGAVQNMKELHLDKHFKERRFFDIIDHGKNIGKRPIPRQIPANFYGIPEYIPTRAPYFGQDNEYVFRNLLNMNEAEITKLEAENVVGNDPKFPPGRPTSFNFIEKQAAGTRDQYYLTELKNVYGSDIGQ